MELIHLTPHQWRLYSEAAHKVCFNEERNKDFERLDGAIMVVKDDTPLVYCTYRETDGETVYMQHGGSFPSAKGTTSSFTCYLAMMDHLKSKYVRISTLIENTNTPMLKFAMKAGLRIVGVRTVGGSIMLENLWEKHV